MRKIIVGAQISMDGVMQAPGAQLEDPTKGSKFGGWVMPYFDKVFGEEIPLLANDLVDAISTFTVPVVLGGGKKLFADGSVPHSYTLTRSRVSSTGLLIGHYERAGGITTGDAAVGKPSQAEEKRRERMSREG